MNAVRIKPTIRSTIYMLKFDNKMEWSFLENNWVILLTWREKKNKDARDRL